MREVKKWLKLFGIAASGEGKSVVVENELLLFVMSLLSSLDIKQKQCTHKKKQISSNIICFEKQEILKTHIFHKF